MQPQRSRILISLEGLPPLHLDGKCSECSGFGNLAAPEWITWQEDYEQSCKDLGSGAKDLLDPEEVVPYPKVEETTLCTGCDGLGTRPTPAGRAILELVQRYLKL